MQIIIVNNDQQSQKKQDNLFNKKVVAVRTDLKLFEHGNEKAVDPCKEYCFLSPK